MNTFGGRSSAMRLDQTALVARVSRRRLIRHAAALQSGLLEARRAITSGGLDAARREALERVAKRLEVEIERLEATAAVAPPAQPLEVALVYNAADRD